ncbi:MAG: carbonic anhydrase [Stellaceae bacterium]
MSLLALHKGGVGACHGCGPEPSDRRPELDRRRLLGLFGLGAAYGIAGTGLLGHRAFAAPGTEALLLSCIDYRLTAATTRYMADRQMEGKYDQFILAGAALGVENRKFSEWGRTFWEHVQLAIELHQIRRIIVMDHRDCGFYKAIHGKDLAADPAEELTVHAAQMHLVKADIGRRHPKLAVELLLMGLDGKAETVA